MRTELGDDQWLELDQGRLTGPDGRVYQRRGTLAKRRRCEEAVAAGVPLVLRYWAGGQLDWYDGDDETLCRADAQVAGRC